MEIDPERASPFNPLAGNPLRTREDVAAALSACSAPLDQLDRSAMEGTTALENFARPLWGLAVAGGQTLKERIERLANGTNPDHPDYWRAPGPHDQKIVELAAIGFALCMDREAFWEPLDMQAKANLSAYLQGAAAQPVFDNNWHFFPVLIALGLRHVGETYDANAIAAHLDAIDGFYLGEGWYSDGTPHRVDHYCGFAFHFYALLYCRSAPEDEARCATYRQRATVFAGQFLHWFADDGAALPYGRSLAYRFACAAFFGACAFAGVEALPWSVMKGLYLRHLRWWRQWPVAQQDGPLSIGYGYPNAQVAEEYLSPASPYWAFKAFLPLALADDHPFWQAEEAPLPPRASVHLAQPGMILAHEPGQTIALAAGQAAPHFHGSPEKYAKFAYSTRYAFNVETGPGSFDGMIGLSDGSGEWRIRENCAATTIMDDILYARWLPWTDTSIETWLYWDRPWHIRVHRIRSVHALETIEGGFCLPGEEAETQAASRRAHCYSTSDFSGIIDLSPDARSGRIVAGEPDTNLLHRRTLVPQLAGRVEAGETVLACAVIASPDIAAAHAAWARPPRDLRRLQLP